MVQVGRSGHANNLQGRGVRHGEKGPEEGSDKKCGLICTARRHIEETVTGKRFKRNQAAKAPQRIVSSSSSSGSSASAPASPNRFPSAYSVPNRVRAAAGVGGA